MEVLSQETGIGVRTIRDTVRKYTGKESKENKMKIRPTIIEKIDDFKKYAIRQKIHNFWFRHELPTLKNILLAINADPDLPILHIKSLKIVLKNLSFENTRWNRNSFVLTERGDLVLWRRKYIDDIRRYRNEGRTIYYLEETLVDCIGECSSEDVAGVDVEAPGGVGKQLIVLHIGSADGFVEGGLLCLESKASTSSDYHDHVDGDVFYDWFRGVLPLLKDNSVVVMDNASCYSVKNPEPAMSWKKDRILRWLEDKGVVFDKPMVKFQLIEKAKEIRHIFDKYSRSIQEAINYNKAILRLPPYHSDLNPIQSAWSVVNSYVKTNNCTSFNPDDVRQLLSDGVKLVTPEMWADYVSHSIKEEDKLWNLDFITDDMLERAESISNVLSVTVDSSASELSDYSCDD